jgi:hypothetical protein
LTFKENGEELNSKAFFFNDMMVNEIKENEMESSNGLNKLKIHFNIDIVFVY